MKQTERRCKHHAFAETSSLVQNQKRRRDDLISKNSRFQDIEIDQLLVKVGVVNG